MLRVKRQESPFIRESGWYRGYASSLFTGDGAFFYVMEISNGISNYSRSSTHLADHKNKGEMNHGYERKTSGTG